LQTRIVVGDIVAAHVNSVVALETICGMKAVVVGLAVMELLAAG